MFYTPIQKNCWNTDFENQLCSSNRSKYVTGGFPYVSEERARRNVKETDVPVAAEIMPKFGSALAHVNCHIPNQLAI